MQLFRSLFDDQQSFAHLIIADPPTKSASTSGELRVTREWTAGDLQHRVHVSVRSRDRHRLAAQ
jgi:iron complex outermembrane recepter protein